MKKITILTLLVTMVTMKEGNHRWPKLALIFYVSIKLKISSDVHQQTVYSIILFFKLYLFDLCVHWLDLCGT